MRVFLAALIVCLFVASARAENLPSTRSGVASCYGRENHQVRTATGAAYDPWRLTAAHRSLPFGTRVLVCRARANYSRCVVVTINDRGPFVRGRDIDLSLGACRAIGNSGLARVSLQIIEEGHAAHGSVHRRGWRHRLRSALR